MQRAYKAATKASIDELEALEGRIAEREANGEPPSETILWMRQRIIDNIEELGRNLKKFSAEGTQITIDGQTEAATLANDATQSLVEAAAGKKPANVSIDTSWTNLPDEQLQAFVGFAGDGSPLAELFNKIPQVTTDAMQMALVQGISLGEGPRTVARRVRKAADIGRQRAETIARTEMIRASREAQRQLYTQNPAVQGYRRQATQDARVCLACLALSGTLQATDTIMPSHPNCRCVMIPATMSWAEITGDDSIPDTRPEVATPERILAGLTDAEKMAIMGPARFELYKNGKPLLDMVQVKQDKDWGPTTQVLPLRDIGGPLRVQLPTAPKTPKGAEAPKPIEVVEPPINRDPQALLEEFRKIALPKDVPNIGVLQKEFDDIGQRKNDILALTTDDKFERMNQWFKTDLPRYQELLQTIKQAKGELLTNEQVIQMHDLLKSTNPIKYKNVDYDNVAQRLDDNGNVIQGAEKWHLSKREIVVAKKNRKVMSETVDYVMEFIDDRPLSFYGKSMNRGIEPDEIRITEKNSMNAYGQCSWQGQGFVTLNTKDVPLPDKMTNTTWKMQTGSSTLAHEMMHWLDRRSLPLRKKIDTFFAQRTAGEQWMYGQYGGLYKKDKWPDSYSGQRYEQMEQGFYNDGTGLEVPTRGIQHLLENPLKFAEDDFEYFSFIVKNVLGSSE
jgi:SPP1 gp7 family putative phage head morphogenesis protein